MPTLSEIRQQYPQYADMSDAALANALHSKFYADMPRERFDAKIGFDTKTAGVGGAGAALKQGVTFGFADEVAGAGRAAGRFLRSVTRDGKSMGEAWDDAGQAYNRGVGAERNSVAQFRESNPGTAIALEAAGGFLGGAPRIVSETAARMTAPQLLGSAFKRGPVLPDMATAVGAATAPMSTGRAALQAAKAGATGGAVAGFGSAEGGLENRATGAAIGGTVGGFAGGALPLAANVVGRYGGRFLDGLGLRNPQAGGDRQLLRAFERDAAGGGPSLDDVARLVGANVGDNYRPEFIPDMAGENVKRLASMTTQTPGAARQVAQTAISQRTAGQADRISDDVMRLLSPNSDWHGTVDALQQARSAASKPLYDKAMSANAWSPRIDDFMNDPIAKQGLREGLEILRLESVARGEPFNAQQLGVVFNEAGEPALVGRPNMRVMQSVKEGIDNILEGYRDKVTGRLALDKRGNAIKEFQESFLKTIDDLNPAYKEARAAWAGPSRAKDMLAMGRQVFGADDEITAKTVSRLSQSEKEMFLAGVARAIKDRVENSADGRNAVAAFFNRQSFRDKLKAAFPNEEAFNKFAGMMQRENNMFEGQRVYGPRAGSPTQRNMADAEDAGIDPMGGVLGALASGGGFRGAMAAGTGNVMRRAQGMNSASADYLGPILFETGQRQQMDQLARLLAARQQGQISQGQNQALARALLGGAGIGSGVQTDQRQ